jgi:hypothetical protein
MVVFHSFGVFGGGGVEGKAKDASPFFVEKSPNMVNEIQDLNIN